MQWELLDRARKYAEERGLECVGGDEVGARGARAAGRRCSPALETDPDAAGRPARLGGQAPADRRLPRAPRPRAGTTPAWRRWTCSTTTCGPRSRSPPASASSGSPPTTRSSAAVHRAARRTPGPTSGAGACSAGPTSIVAANWDSLVFDVGGDPLRRVPMMEPLAWNRGPRGYVDRRVRRRRPSCSTELGLVTGRQRKVEDHGRTRAEEEAGTRPSRTRSSRTRPRSPSSGEKIKAELDDLLDEIDEVLETNAEDFVKSLRPEGRRSSRRSLRGRPGGVTRCR